MITSIQNMINYLVQIVGWLGSFNVGGITILGIAFWLFALRMIPNIMKLISTLSNSHISHTHSRKVKSK